MWKLSPCQFPGIIFQIVYKADTLDIFIYHISSIVFCKQVYHCIDMHLSAKPCQWFMQFGEFSHQCLILCEPCRNHADHRWTADTIAQVWWHIFPQIYFTANGLVIRKISDTFSVDRQCHTDNITIIEFCSRNDKRRVTRSVVVISTIGADSARKFCAFHAAIA